MEETSTVELAVHCRLWQLHLLLLRLNSRLALLQGWLQGLGRVPRKREGVLGEWFIHDLPLNRCIISSPNWLSNNIIIDGVSRFQVFPVHPGEHAADDVGRGCTGHRGVPVLRDEDLVCPDHSLHDLWHSHLPDVSSLLLFQG